MANNISRTRRGTLKGFVGCATFVASMLIPYAAAAQTAPPTNWVDWDIPDPFPSPPVSTLTTTGGFDSTYITSVTGTATIPGTSIDLIVTHTGETNSNSENNSTQWIVGFTPVTATDFDDSTANNGWYTQSPDSPNSPNGSDMIVQTGYTTAAGKQHKLAFSKPVSNVLMAFYSFGGATTGGNFSITFDQPFKIISRTGQVTFGGNLQDSFYANGEGGLVGTTLTGLEGSGVVQFTGDFTHISWEVTASEYYTGFTVGFSVVTTAIGPSRDATQQSLDQTATELGSVFGQQNASVVEGLNYTCDQFGKHGLCVSIGGRYTSADGEAERASGVAIVAAKLNNNFRVGGWLDAGSYTEEPDSIEFRDRQPTFGFYSVFNADASGSGWEVRVAGSYANNDITVTRGVIADSEAGRGATELESYGIGGTISYNLPVAGNWVVSPYAGVRYTQTASDAFMEGSTSEVTSPLSISALTVEATTLLLGFEASGALASNVSLFGHIGLEKDLEQSSSDYLATGIDGLTAVSFDPSIDSQRLSAGLGAHIDLSATERLTFSGNYRGEPGQSDRYAATGMVFWTAGF